ncbi:MAG TPA: DUF2076 domain-containing protein [Lamprocystis sp. (in: g-proteobacteria)]|nr:DUF2076 domain-containing protein [Lamprocystis sp. (in: g-proteobacteria)]
MNIDERNLIEGLFTRLQQAEAQAGPRDAEAEQLIQGLMARQPAASYLLAQVALVQEHGLRNLQTRVEELERDLAARPQGGGGLLGGLFGGRPQGNAQPAMPARSQPPARGGWGNSGAPAPGAMSMQSGAQGGGFMAGAMQTAMGVAGGVLIGNAIGGLFAGDAAATPTPAEPPAAAPDEPAAGEEDGGMFGDMFGGDEEGF